MTELRYQMNCDCTSHDPIGYQFEDGSEKMKGEAVDPVDGRCLDWHPQLVSFEPVEVCLPDHHWHTNNWINDPGPAVLECCQCDKIKEEGGGV